MLTFDPSVITKGPSHGVAGEEVVVNLTQGRQGNRPAISSDWNDIADQEAC